MDRKAKTAVLNQTQLSVLENALAAFGNVVTFAQLATVIPISEPAGKRQFVARLVQIGWLLRIKNGVYQISDLSTLGTLTLSRYAVAHILVPESYVSFENALQYHGLHDQLMQVVTSVSLRQHADAEAGGLRYRFVKTKTTFFFGFVQENLDGQPAQIATPEKAMIDLVQLHRTAYSVDRVAEILAASRHMLNLDRLTHNLPKTNLTTQRIFGFLFDVVGIVYDEELLQRARAGQAASHMTPASSTYCAKWRLYYDARVVERYGVGEPTL
jgi:predicted transcriptional regulator of viral defense system